MGHLTHWNCYYVSIGFGWKVTDRLYVYEFCHCKYQLMFSNNRFSVKMRVISMNRHSASATSLLVLKLLKDVKWVAIRKLHLQEGSILQTSSIVSNLQHLLAFSKTTGSGLFKFLRIDYSDFNILCNVLQQHVRTPIEKCFTNHSNA